MKKITYIIMIISFSTTLFAQPNVTDSSKLVFSGYSEIYYGYDFNRPLNNTRPSFVYNFNRTNEVNVNIAYIKAAYSSDRVRSNLAFMAGTYANANLAAEPGVLKNIYEANAGIKLLKNEDLWLDAGVFDSHIGFESVIGKDEWALTRSISAENSPYYESGANLNYTTKNGKLFFSLLLLNGWQHIQRPNYNTGVSEGLQVTYQPNDNLTFNYSNFYGNDKPDSVSRERFYNDFYAILQLSKKFGVTAGLDFAMEQAYKGSSTYNYLYSPVLILRYKPVDDLAIAARAEYYQDPNGILITTNTAHGFKTTGYSLNVDYSPFKNVLLRIEGKYFSSKDAIFNRDNQPANGDVVLTTSMAISF